LSILRRAGLVNLRSYVKTVWFTAVLTAIIGVCEGVYGYTHGSSFLTQDAVGWAYGALIYTISAISFEGSPQSEFSAAAAIAVILALSGFHGTYDVVTGLLEAVPDDPSEVAASSELSLVVALLVAILLWRFRRSHDPVVEGSWLSARNDVLSGGLDTSVILVSNVFLAKWPQIISDGIGVALSFQAAYVVARDALQLRRAISGGDRPRQ
jgi:Co/Zn/Cd efflux system component